jgi:hypothetical protein
MVGERWRENMLLEETEWIYVCVMLIVKQNVATNSVDIVFFSAIGVMLESEGIAYLV